jgi:hypothetical protein
MEWLIKHWWILVLVFLVGVIINVIKDQLFHYALIHPRQQLQVGGVHTFINFVNRGVHG